MDAKTTRISWIQAQLAFHDGDLVTIDKFESVGMNRFDS